jgi:hypothetical protein
VVRITVTGILHAKVGSEAADVVFHDLAGWLMMPLALVLLWAEMRLLALLLLEPEPDDLPVVGLGVAARPKPAVRAGRGAEANVV